MQQEISTDAGVVAASLSPKLESQFWQKLQKQQPQEQYRQICSVHEIEIYWQEQPMHNARTEDKPYCPECGEKPIKEWLVLDSVKDEILYSGCLLVEADTSTEDLF